MKKILKLAGVAGVVLFGGEGWGKDCVWVGGAEGGNLTSVAANWEGGAVPESGDAVKFSGMNCEVVNDLSEDVVIKTIVFENDGSEGKTAGFTITGNKLKISEAVENKTPKSGTITDTFDADVEFTGWSLRLGGNSQVRRDIKFNKTLSGTGKIETHTQYKGTVTFCGKVTAERLVRSNGDAGGFELCSTENEFTGQLAAGEIQHVMHEGVLKIPGPGALGGTGGTAGGVRLILGDPTYGPKWGTLKVDSATDCTFDMAMTVYGYSRTKNDGAGARLENMRAGTTARFTGAIIAGSTKQPTSGDPTLGDGMVLELPGAGDGELAGNIESEIVWIRKKGSGTWTLSGDSASRGRIAVHQGTLLVNGNHTAAEALGVKAMATVGGTGVVSKLEFEGPATLKALRDGDGDFAPLRVAGEVMMMGDVTVDLGDETTLKEGTYELMRFGSRSGAGNFAVPVELAERCELTASGTGLTLKILPATAPAEELTWAGGEGAKWNKTDANWAGGKVFEDGNYAKFPAGVAGTVEVEGEVRPGKVTVEDGGAAYTISGDGTIAGSGGLFKRGTGELTIANRNTYTGPTVVEEGTLTLTGTNAGTTVRVAAGAAFTNAVTGRLSGDGGLWVMGTAELAGTNDFTGGLTIAGAGCTILDPMAMGAGNVRFDKPATFIGNSGATGVGKVMTIMTEGNYMKASGVTVHWLGDVEAPGIRPAFFTDWRNNASGWWAIGTEGGNNTFKAGGVSARGAAGGMRWHARIELTGSFYQTDSNTHYFHASGNKWTYMEFNVGTAVCCAENALAKAPVRLGQKYLDVGFHPVLDLNGYDQTISALIPNTASVAASSQTVKSDEPATLTIETDTDTATERVQAVFRGKVSLRKRGAGKWTTGMKNEAEGQVTVEEGVMSCMAGDVLPVNKDLRVTVAKGAKLEIAEGVELRAGYATFGSRMVARGVYGGPECGVAGVTRVAELGGMGVLRVERGDGRFVLIVR